METVGKGKNWKSEKILLEFCGVTELRVWKQVNWSCVISTRKNCSED